MYNTLLWTFHRIGFDATFNKTQSQRYFDQLHGFEIKTMVSSIKNMQGHVKQLKVIKPSYISKINKKIHIIFIQLKCIFVFVLTDGSLYTL